jgi:hypothetical protein
LRGVAERVSREMLDKCPGCGSLTETVVGHCPNCGFAKNPRVSTFKERYIARGPGPDLGLLGSLVISAIPGATIMVLGLLVFDSIAVTVIGAAILIVGPVVSSGLSG